MNALELADKLMSSLTMEYDCNEYMEQAAAKLRQQQRTIDWQNGEYEALARFQKSLQVQIEALKTKTLTDEEILELAENWLDMSFKTGVIDFARAILRKASEK
jgi:hypothetical protein